MALSSIASAAATRSYPDPANRNTDWRDDLFTQQKEFFACSGRYRAAVCGRRAGKSFGDAYWLIEGALQAPGAQSRFIALSRPHCRDILWPTMQDIAKAHPELGLRLREVDNQLTVQLPNGHQIKLAGCKDRSEMEKFRGLKLKRVVIDEAGSFGPHLEELVTEVLRPTLTDLRGQIALTGTPPPVPQGYFYRVTTGDGGKQWPVFHWTMRENPYIPHAEQELRDILEENGWTEDHPRFRREYLGQWIRDEGSLVYPYDPTRNGVWPSDIPEVEWVYGTGMDFGVKDATAWVAASWQRGLPTLWFRKSVSEEDLSPSTVAVRTQVWRAQYPGRVVGDSGGQGAAQVKEYQERCPGMAIESARKHDKRVAIEFMRGDMLSGVIKADRVGCASLIEEWSRLQWNEQHTDVDPRFPDHEAHAALYLHRETRLQYRPEQEDPKPGTEEAHRAEMDRLRARAAKKVAERRRQRESRW